MISELNCIECITLFTEDLEASKKFYKEVFGLKIILEDASSSVVRIGNVMLNLLKVSEAPELITPVKIADRSNGARLMFTIKVKSVDAVCAELQRHHVKLLNGPIDRPWGRRTAAFLDPSGHPWEIAQEI
jgi:lactoylglutathione lyase